MWEIYAYHNTEALSGIFNAIAAIMASNTYLSAIAAVAFCGFVAAMITYREHMGWPWPIPQWVRDALDAGKTLADFAVGGATTHATAKKESNTTAAKKTASKAAKKRAKKPGSAKYTDRAGNSWSGRGPQPNWLKDALAGGKTLDDLRA